METKIGICKSSHPSSKPSEFAYLRGRGLARMGKISLVVHEVGSTVGKVSFTNPCVYETPRLLSRDIPKENDNAFPQQTAPPIDLG